MRTATIALALLLLLAVPEASAQANATAAPTPTPAPAPGPDAGECAGDPLCGNPCSVQWFQAHGWLLWVGFGLLMPTGIITARHLQNLSATWFHVHIACMTLGIACVIAGCSIGFAKFEAIPDTPLDDAAALHVYFGLAVFLLACVNFLLGLIRPHKGNVPRLFWYIAHFTFGTCVVAFAWFVIFTGMDIYEENWVPAGVSDLHIEKILFAIQISVMGYAYLFMGRWDYTMSQTEKDAPSDGIKSRFTSMWHVSSMMDVQGDKGGPHSEA